MTQKIVVQNLSTKPGVSTKTGKEYIKFGIQDANGVWYSTFQNPNAVKGGEYEIEYEQGQFGNDIKSIKPLSVTGNQTATMNRNTSIVRQHSQEMALMYLIANNKDGFTLDQVWDTTTSFQKDVEDTEQPF